MNPCSSNCAFSGILDSLEARNRQAIDSQVPYTDLPAMLIQDEIARREQRQFAQRLRRAQVMTDKTIERLDLSASVSINHALVAELGDVSIRDRACADPYRRPNRNRQVPIRHSALATAAARRP